MGGGVPAGSPEWSWNAAGVPWSGNQKRGGLLVRAKVCDVARVAEGLGASSQGSCPVLRVLNSPSGMGRRPKDVGT